MFCTCQSWKGILFLCNCFVGIRILDWHPIYTYITTWHNPDCYNICHIASYITLFGYITCYTKNLFCCNISTQQVIQQFLDIYNRLNHIKKAALTILSHFSGLSRTWSAQHAWPTSDYESGNCRFLGSIQLVSKFLSQEAFNPGMILILKWYTACYMCPSGTQIHCCNVIYNNFVCYITCYITKF